MSRKGSDDEKVVQDGEREELLRGILRLQSTGQRIGVDAYDELRYPYELKSTTCKSVSTGRDVSPDTVARWRTRFWVIGAGRYRSTGFLFDELWFLAPEHLEPWYQALEGYWEPRVALWRRVDERLVGFDVVECEMVRELMECGMRRNNPKIPMKYVRQHGIRLEGDEAVHLRRLRTQYATAVRQEGACEHVIMTG